MRAELRAVDLKAGRRLQVTTTDGRTPLTRNYPADDGAAAAAAVDELLAEPFGTWRVETGERVVQLRVTKKGQAQVHSAATSRGEVSPAVPRDATAHRGLAHDRASRHLLDPGDPLFTALGADADKRRQVDAFLRQVDAATRHLLAEEHPGDHAEGPPLQVVDLGCGNAYLTFAAHRWLSGLPVVAQRGVRTVGIDVRPDMVSRNTRLATELGMAGLTFVAGTIADADEPEDGVDADADAGVDVVLALHACDTATDDALARAVRRQARVVLAAPCCHHDLQRQLAAARAAGHPAPHPYGALTRHPILSERFADVLTDALRADLLRLLGYRVDVVEFVDSRHTPRNALIRARRTGSQPSLRRRREYAHLVREWHVHPALARLLADELGDLPEPGDSGEVSR